MCDSFVSRDPHLITSYATAFLTSLTIVGNQKEKKKNQFGPHGTCRMSNASAEANGNHPREEKEEEQSPVLR